MLRSIPLLFASDVELSRNHRHTKPRILVYTRRIAKSLSLKGVGPEVDELIGPEVLRRCIVAESQGHEFSVVISLQSIAHGEGR